MDPKKTARTAGMLYLIVVLTGIFNLAYVPSRLINWDDAIATFQNIQTSETLFRLGIFAGFICYIAFLILPLVLYKLLHSVHKPSAVGMVALAITSVPISLVNLMNKFAILTLIKEAGQLAPQEMLKLADQVMLYLDHYSNGIQLVSVFWGLWLFPFGYLVFKSDFLPKIVGVFLMLGCVGYLLNFTGKLLYPGYGELGISGFIALPATIGEIGACLWLLIVGIKNKHTPENASLKS